MVNRLTADALTPINTNEYLPPTRRWVSWGSWFIVFALGSAIAASFTVKYRTTVNVHGVIRPVGETRLVQAIASGAIVDIAAQNNTPLQKGDVIARIDTASLEARAAQLLANVEQSNSKQQQIQAQIRSIEQQIIAETAQSKRSVAALIADAEIAQRSNRDQSIAAQAAVQEAQAQIDLAAREVNSYSQLSESGAVSQLQLSEKQAALETARARMVSVQASLNPSRGSVQAAQQRIAQAEATGESTLAQLQQSKQQLMQEGLDIEKHLKATEQEIAQVNLELENATVRSPVTGTLHELRLRNIGQVVTPGETIATVIPTNAPIEIQALVPATKINKVEIGLPTRMRVSACPFSEFGTAAGQVKSISPDTVSLPSQSPAGSAGSAAVETTVSPSAFYSTSIAIEESSLFAKNTRRRCALQPGTGGQVTIIAREETVIAFLRRKAGLFQK
ncbi:MAG: HlyD family efflux transporter periplasmic adaptor subunit [Cyanobacteria bacterium J06629_19]